LQARAGGLQACGLGQVHPEPVAASEDGEQANPVFARSTRSNVGEGFGKADGIIHLQQKVCDADVWQSLVQIQNEAFRFGRNGGAQAVDLQGAVFDSATRNGARLGGLRPPLQCFCHAGSTVGQPIGRIKGHDQPLAFGQNMASWHVKGSSGFLWRPSV